MSYILDALKRADAERTRGAVPGLHTRQVASPPAAPASLVARHRLWLVAGAALVVCAIAAGLWRWQAPASGWGAGAPAPTVAVVTPEPSAPLVGSAPASATAPALAPAPALAKAAAPATAAPRAAASAPRVVAAAPQPVSKPSPRPAPAASAPVSRAPPKPRPRPETRLETVTRVPDAPAAGPTVAAMPRAAVPLLGDLADSVRRDIPPLAITGSVYSDNPAKRLLLVNNQVLPQGSLAAPEVRLEEIHAKDSVFSFRGMRFRLAH